MKDRVLGRFEFPRDKCQIGAGMSSHSLFFRKCVFKNGEYRLNIRIIQTIVNQDKCALNSKHFFVLKN